MGAVGTQMNLHSQPQVASPKAPEKLVPKPLASADAKMLKEMSQDSPLRPPKSSTEAGSNPRNHSNQAPSRVNGGESNAARNLSPQSMIQPSQIQANSLIEQKIVKMLPIAAQAGHVQNIQGLQQYQI